MNDEDDSGGYDYGNEVPRESGRRLPSKAVIVGILFLIAYWLIWNNFGDIKPIPLLPSMNEWSGTMPTALVGALILFVYLKLKQKRGS
jgi:predicted transporter